jgi:hypothetical protein
MGYKRLDAEDFVISADAVESTAWSTNVSTLTSFFTSSVQKIGASGDYYLSIFQVAATNDEAAVQFDVAYGNVNGSGSRYYDTNYPNLTPSSTIYGQYRSMILEDENSSFIFGDGTNTHTTEDFYVVSVDRARYKESIFPSTLNFNLKNGSNTIHLTNNSADTQVQSFLGTSKVYQIVSGSNGSAVSDAAGGYVAGKGSYGLFFPELGTILLNPDAINQTIGLAPDRTANASNLSNPSKIYNMFESGGSFKLNAQETITSDYVFCRARNSEFNYSTNPSYISGSTGEVVHNTFINNPQTYVTTVGMYNDANELVAVAKLSKPLLKNFTKESLIRVKLDF